MGIDPAAGKAGDPDIRPANLTFRLAMTADNDPAAWQNSYLMA